MPQRRGDVWTGVSYGAASHALGRKQTPAACSGLLPLALLQETRCRLPERTRVVPTSASVESAWDPPSEHAPRSQEMDRLTGQQERPLRFSWPTLLLCPASGSCPPTEAKRAAGGSHPLCQHPAPRPLALRPCSSQKEPPSPGLKCLVELPSPLPPHQASLLSPEWA